MSLYLYSTSYVKKNLLLLVKLSLSSCAQIYTSCRGGDGYSKKWERLKHGLIPRPSSPNNWGRGKPCIASPIDPANGCQCSYQALKPLVPPGYSAGCCTLHSFLQIKNWRKLVEYTMPCTASKWYRIFAGCCIYSTVLLLNI